MTRPQPDIEWITAQGWTTKHQVKPGSGHPPSEPQARWTMCGRLMMRPLLWLPDGLTECGQCVRRRAAL